MENEEKQPNKRPVGRPRTETRINPMWKEIILESGREGKHITDFLIKLGISWDNHYEMIKRNKEYSQTVKEYNKLCENWWYEKALESVRNGESNKFNQRLWTVIMKNKFRDQWTDEKQIDITTQGDKINQDNKIQIEIVKNKLDDEN
jgi:predicted nucleotide-binding protein (sugar kinase/HSP70/actin superfamily)